VSTERKRGPRDWGIIVGFGANPLELEGFDPVAFAGHVEPFLSGADLGRGAAGGQREVFPEHPVEVLYVAPLNGLHELYLQPGELSFVHVCACHRNYACGALAALLAAE